MEKSSNYEQVKETVDKSIASGVELWQANFEITPNMVKLNRYFKNNLDS